MKFRSTALKVVSLCTMVPLVFSGCSTGEGDHSGSTKNSTPSTTKSLQSLNFDNSQWNYDEENNVYWQVGVQYVTNPQDTTYETLGIYVPGQYMTAIKNSDGKYTCTLNVDETVNGYTAETAPMVMPVNTPGYAASPAPTDYNYDKVSEYVKEGFIYIEAGIRGRAFGQVDATSLVASGSAPWGVTDLKAAIRYIRYNASILPGDAEKFFSFGMSGGGAQSSLLGATGNSELYTPYLNEIGAAMKDANGNEISDALYGTMAWCPITSLDYANEAYEWMMGQYFTTDTRAENTFTSELSKDLAASFADYINELGLTDSKGNDLTLTKSTEGVYTSGTYYDYLLTVVNDSINNFLKDTTFPYTSGGKSGGPGGFGFNPGGRDGQDGKPEGTPPQGANGQQPNDGINRGDDQKQETAVTYETASDYINALNAEDKWIQYDESTNTAKITSLEEFVTHAKNASKSVGAFDDLSRSQGENSVFGVENNPLHFDSTMAKLLNQNQEKYATFADWNGNYVSDYAKDIKTVDELGISMQTRIDMYNPLYFLLPYYEGNNTSTVAKYWRIRTGISQPDTSLSVETNLALALSKNENVKDVDFATIWDQKHVEAEETGDSTTNFIKWVNDCVNNNL